MDKLFSHSLWDREYNGSQVVGLSGDSVLLVRAHVRLKRPDIDMAHKLGSAFLRGLEKHRDAEWLGAFTLDVSTVRFAETLAGGGSEEPWEHEEYLHWEANQENLSSLDQAESPDLKKSGSRDPSQSSKTSKGEREEDRESNLSLQTPTKEHQPNTETNMKDKKKPLSTNAVDKVAPSDSSSSSDDKTVNEANQKNESPFINEQRVGWGEWSSWSECSPCSPQFDQIRTRRYKFKIIIIMFFCISSIPTILHHKLILK